MTRFFANWMAIRALAYNGHLEHAEQLLSRFTPFVTDLDSRQASRLLADLHATIASTRQGLAGRRPLVRKGRLTCPRSPDHVVRSRCSMASPGHALPLPGA